MATYSKRRLSGSSDGRPIQVTSTSSIGTFLHITPYTPASPDNLDEIWLYATNSGSVSVKLTIEFGGSSTSDQIEVTIPSESGLSLVIPGLVLLHNEKQVTAFASIANVLAISGYVNRIS